VTAPKQSWFRSGLRFCGSCCITVGCWGLWIVLGSLLSILAYIALAKELPVPGFMLRQAETRLAESGLGLKFGRARLDPSGKVLLEDVQLRTRQFDDPLLLCRFLYIRHSLWSVLSGRMEPDEIRIEGASLRLPAMISPSGTAEALVSDLAITLRHGDHVWHVDQFAGRMGRLKITVQGDVAIAGRAPGAMPLSLDVLTSRYIRTARQLAPVLRRLDAFEDPSLAIRLSTADSGHGLLADGLFTAGAARHLWNQPLEFGPLVAGVRVRLDGAGPRPLEVQLATRNVAWRGNMAAENVRAVLRTEVKLRDYSARPLELLAAAGSFKFDGESAIGPMVRADLSAWPLVRTGVASQLEGEFLAAEIEAGLRDRSARIHAEGRGSPVLINRVLARHTPRAAPYFGFGDPVAFTADAVLSPGWKFATLASRASAGRIDSRGVKITAARGRIEIAGMDFRAHDARVEMGENFARGSYWMNFASTDYRMLLEGRLRPVEISGWFRGDWWPVFWNRYFAFPVTPPVADVDLQGRWKDPYQSNNFVRAQAALATIWGGDFEQVDATVFVRPFFTHGLRVEGGRGGGAERLEGTFKRFGVPGSRDTARFEFDLTTNAQPAVLGRMLEGRADDVLASLRFTRPPRVHAWGAIDGNRPDYRFTGEVPDPLHYFGFPLESVRVAGQVQGTDVQLDEIRFAAAGGKGGGKAALGGAPGARRLGFDLFVNKTNLARAVHAVQEYEANRTGVPAPATEAKFVQQAANSSVDVALSAQGDPADIASFKGAGNAALTGAELGEIHLFGLLSQVLSGLSFSFSSLKLDAARTSFTLQNGELLFPDFKVTGPSAVIDGRGKYTIATSTLDFAARFKPYETPESLLAAAFSLVLNPLASILELKLTGQLADPKWSVSVSAGSDPSKPSAPARPPPTANPPAPK
jgi:hypothetical protein